MGALKSRLRALPERHGRTTLILLLAILALGFGLRAYRVVEPLKTPGDDAHAYYALSKALYTEGSYGGPEFEDASDWSPGAPLLYAAAFYATGGAREGTARIVELLLGMATIVVVYLLGRRIACRPAGLIAAFAVAVYPPFIHSVGALYSEPLAMCGPARRGPRVPLGERAASACGAWLARPGLLFGVTAMARPEYLLVGVAFVLLAAIRVGRARGWRPGLAGAALLLAGLALPIVPWTVRNVVVLDRAVTISTGGGKALYVGTYLPADGEYQRVKALLLEKYEHRSLDPNSAGARRSRPGAALQPRRRPLPRPAPRPGAGQDRQARLLQVLRRRPGRLPGDDRPQGRPDVEQRDRRSDELDRRARRPDPARRARPGRPRRCSPCGAAGGSWSRWRRRSRSSPRSARPPWPPRGATRC